MFGNVLKCSEMFGTGVAAPQSSTREGGPPGNVWKMLGKIWELGGGGGRGWGVHLTPER